MTSYIAARMGSIVKITLLILSLLSFQALSIDAQTRTIKTHYQDGQVESRGKMYFFSNYDKRIPKEYEYFTGFKKKHGEWKYWYPNGKLARIENYILDKNILKADDLPHGKWTYYTEDGIKYREDVFSLGTLIEFEKPFYHNSFLLGKIKYANGQSDTLIFNDFQESRNLVINGEFEYFFYQPIKITYSGKSKIEEWLPFWTTPGSQTPDYISNLRQIEFLDYNTLHSKSLPDEFNYVGLALYTGKQENYSEYIQGQLTSPLVNGKTYCVKVSINACLYSGYRINALGLHFSETPYNYVNTTRHIPQLLFENLPELADDFIDICKKYVASGGERIITIGRFTNLKQTSISPAENPIPTRFGLNNSAYYLINKIEVFEIEDDKECNCNISIIPDTTTNNLSDKNIHGFEFNVLREGNSVVIKNLLFNFDSYDLKANADSILLGLYKYLDTNMDIKISIEGHTDDLGSQEYNKILSENRAKSVYIWLKNKGINPLRLSYKGYGKQNPVIIPSSEKDRELNRRVEVRIINEPSYK